MLRGLEWIKNDGRTSSQCGGCGHTQLFVSAVLELCCHNKPHEGTRRGVYKASSCRAHQPVIHGLFWSKCVPDYWQKSCLAGQISFSWSPAFQELSVDGALINDGLVSVGRSESAGCCCRPSCHASGERCHMAACSSGKQSNKTSALKAFHSFISLKYWHISEELLAVRRM